MEFRFGRGFNSNEGYVRQLVADGHLQALPMKCFKFADEDIYCEKFKLKDFPVILEEKKEEIDALFQTNLEKQDYDDETPWD